MWMGNLMADARFALRSFRKSPGFVAAALLVLGLGIGGVTLMFSTLNSVVLRPLPFPESDRLVWAWGTSESQPTNSLSAENYADYRDGVDAFESAAVQLVFRPPAVMTGGETPERIVTNVVSVSLFPTLGVAPARGRGFLPEDASSASGNPVIVSAGLAERRFGSERAVGSSLAVDGVVYEVVGVMEAGFDYPGGVDAWFPLRMEEWYAQGRDNNNFNMIARLADGASLQQAQDQIDVVARGLEAAYPDTNEGWGVRLVSMHEQTVSQARPALLMLTALVGLLLLVACANVASISLARATSRRTELAVRLALGASRGRVAGQLLTEHILLAIGGGVVGLALAWFGVEAVRTLGPADLPRLEAIALDAPALMVTFAITLATGLLFGAMPSLSGTRLSLASTLRSGSQGAGRASASRGRNALAVTQIALSLTLLIASGLLVRSFIRMQQVDPGFTTESVLAAELQLVDAVYEEDIEVHQAWDAVYERLGALPGVLSVAGVDQLPIRAGGTYNNLFAEGHEPTSPQDYIPAQRRIVTERYFRTLGIPLLAGRTFETTDDRDTPLSVVISQALADRLWPGEDAVGRNLVWGPTAIQVLGVVGDIKDFGPGAPEQPTFFLPVRQFPRGMGTMRVVVRTDGDPLQLAGALRAAVWEINPNIPVSGIETMTSRLADSLAQPRFRVRLVGAFALMAMLLACLGVYGVLAHQVRQRGQELAVRQALGATGSRIVGFVARKGMTLVGVGVGLGLVGGAVAARLMGAFLFEVGTVDLPTYGAVTGLLLLAALGACVIPALRALRVDPASALKAE